MPGVSRRMKVREKNRAKRDPDHDPPRFRPRPCRDRSSGRRERRVTPSTFQPGRPSACSRGANCTRTPGRRSRQPRRVERVARFGWRGRTQADDVPHGGQPARIVHPRGPWLGEGFGRADGMMGPALHSCVPQSRGLPIMPGAAITDGTTARVKVPFGKPHWHRRIGPGERKIAPRAALIPMPQRLLVKESAPHGTEAGGP